jgi:hypothetical protein
MGGNGETLIRKTVQKLPLVRVQVDVIDLIAILADKVLMFGNKRIEMLRAADSDHLKPALPDKLLQISVYGAEADIGESASNLQENLIRRRMRCLVLHRIPNKFQLLGLSLLPFHGDLAQCALYRSDKTPT